MKGTKVVHRPAGLPFSLVYVTPGVEPGEFTRGDWAIDEARKYLLAVDEHALGKGPMDARMYLSEEEVQGASFHPNPEGLQLMNLPLCVYERLKRQAETAESLRVACRHLVELAHNRDMARLRVLLDSQQGEGAE